MMPSTRWHSEVRSRYILHHHHHHHRHLRLRLRPLLLLPIYYLTSVDWQPLRLLAQSKPISNKIINRTQHGTRGTRHFWVTATVLSMRESQGTGLTRARAWVHQGFVPATLLCGILHPVCGALEINKYSRRKRGKKEKKRSRDVKRKVTATHR
ncbi:hypothetical protein DFP73DRAFT_542438 [Morchella snyderi]|nr:hypothetical protein DFP73DRAFT_542438 [Morchella snyderi]